MLIVVCIISALLVYDWVAALIKMCLPERFTTSVRVSVAEPVVVVYWSMISHNVVL